MCVCVCVLDYEENKKSCLKFSLWGWDKLDYIVV